MADETDNVVPIDSGKKRGGRPKGPVSYLAAGEVPPDYPDTLPRPGTPEYVKWRDGPSPDRQDVSWQWWMHARRAIRAAAGEKQGRPVGSKNKPRVRLTPEEVKEAALVIAAGKVAEDALRASHLVAPHKAAAIAKVIEMLDSSDQADVRFAIKTILEYGDGKPSQTIIQEGGNTPVRIVYETGVLSPLPPFVPGAGVESPGDAIALAEQDAPDRD